MKSLFLILSQLINCSMFVQEESNGNISGGVTTDIKPTPSPMTTSGKKQNGKNKPLSPNQPAHEKTNEEEMKEFGNENDSDSSESEKSAFES